ncbi:MAG TPA: LppP/LprE family lipoprotein [Solirubrobacteraceae bacterium]
MRSEYRTAMGLRRVDMRAVSLSWTLLVLAILACAGCGSTTKTVSVSSAPAPASTSASTSSTATTTTASSTSVTSLPSTTTSATRTASAPAFTHPGDATTSQDAAAAVAVVHAHGYTANDSSQYHPNQTLGVLVGTRSGSGDGYGQQAFFFVNGRYLGTDSSQPSATLRVVSQSDTQVTLAYPLYKSHDALCCPSGGEARVSFQLNNGKLTPLQPIPPSTSQGGLSRQ